MTLSIEVEPFVDTLPLNPAVCCGLLPQPLNTAAIRTTVIIIPIIFFISFHSFVIFCNLSDHGFMIAGAHQIHYRGSVKTL